MLRNDLLLGILVSRFCLNQPLRAGWRHGWPFSRAAADGDAGDSGQLGFSRPSRRAISASSDSRSANGSSAFVGALTFNGALAFCSGGRPSPECCGPLAAGAEGCVLATGGGLGGGAIAGGTGDAGGVARGSAFAAVTAESAFSERGGGAGAAGAGAVGLPGAGRGRSLRRILFGRARDRRPGCRSGRRNNRRRHRRARRRGTWRRRTYRRRSSGLRRLCSGRRSRRSGCGAPSVRFDRLGDGGSRDRRAQRRVRTPRGSRGRGEGGGGRRSSGRRRSGGRRSGGRGGGRLRRRRLGHDRLREDSRFGSPRGRGPERGEGKADCSRAPASSRG